MICNKINISYFEFFLFWTVYRNAIRILILSLQFSYYQQESEAKVFKQLANGHSI